VTSDPRDARLSAIAALAEPVRRALYRYVACQGAPVSRDQVAAGVGVAHHVAKFNLDRLVDDGLLEAEYRRPEGRVGPGAGRPAKLYRRSTIELDITLPERRYDLAGRLLARAMARAEREHRPSSETLTEVASDAGHARGVEARRRLGARPRRQDVTGAVIDALVDEGYEPTVNGSDIALANCPFDSLAREETALVCGMNLAFCRGVLTGAGATALEATLEPSTDHCCVRIHARG
jgi:predicted ArsR family transcriptional regulator